MSKIGDNVGTLYEDAMAMLQRAENAAATHERIARAQSSEGNRIVSEMRSAEFRKEANTLRLLIDYAFVA